MGQHIPLGDKQALTTYRKLSIASWNHPRDPSTYGWCDLPTGAAWQTLLTVADQLTEPAAAALRAADHVLVQRMWAEQAAYVASALRVDDAAARAAVALPDDAALLLGFGRYRQLWLGPTALEQRLFGPAQRG